MAGNISLLSSANKSSALMTDMMRSPSSGSTVQIVEKPASNGGGDVLHAAAATINKLAAAESASADAKVENVTSHSAEAADSYCGPPVSIAKQEPVSATGSETADATKKSIHESEVNTSTRNSVHSLWNHLPTHKDIVPLGSGDESAAVLARFEHRRHTSIAMNRNYSETSQISIPADKNNKAIILDVGGKKHKIRMDNFNIYPNTRLGKLVKAKKLDDILDLCDDYCPGQPPEYFFDRASEDAPSWHMPSPYRKC